MKNITLSYDITSPKLKRINITRIQPYISLQNFITWTGYSGYDPEVSQSESATLYLKSTTALQPFDIDAYLCR